MVVLICHIHHSANNNHGFTSKHAIPLSIRAADKSTKCRTSLFFYSDADKLFSVSPSLTQHRNTWGTVSTESRPAQSPRDTAHPIA